MVSSNARGKGLATAMCQHSLEQAIKLGYKAMQFNFVASTNQGAVRLWKKLGFDTVGHLPKAFNHPQKGYVDALVMYIMATNITRNSMGGKKRRPMNFNVIGTFWQRWVSWHCYTGS